MRRMVQLVLICAASMCLSVVGVANAQDTDRSSADSVKQHAQETFDAAKKYTHEQKEAYQKKMEAEIEDLSRRIGDLKDRAHALKGEALVALEAKLGELKEKQKVAENKVKELRSASSQAWENVKSGAEKAFLDFKKAYEAFGKVLP